RRTSTSIAPCTITGRGASDARADTDGSRETHAVSSVTANSAAMIRHQKVSDTADTMSMVLSTEARGAIGCVNVDGSMREYLMTDPLPARDRALYADIVGGVTTFFTMAYIVVVNPGILSTPGTGMPFTGALTATVLVASAMTLLMGLYAKLPFAVAPGMGLNAFFAFTIVMQSKVPWQPALGMVFWAGVLFLLVSTTPLRETIALAIPPALRAAAAAGIGLLLTFIGLRNAGLIVGDPATLVRMGTLDHRAAFLVLGVLVAFALMRRNNPLAFLTAIFSVTALAWI